MEFVAVLPIFSSKIINVKINVTKDSMEILYQKYAYLVKTVVPNVKNKILVSNVLHPTF